MPHRAKRILGLVLVAHFNCRLRVYPSKWDLYITELVCNHEAGNSTSRLNVYQILGQIQDFSMEGVKGDGLLHYLTNLSSLSLKSDSFLNKSVITFTKI